MKEYIIMSMRSRQCAGFALLFPLAAFALSRSAVLASGAAPPHGYWAEAEGEGAATAMTTDLAGNVYVTGFVNVSGRVKMLTRKYNGSLRRWQQYFDDSGRAPRSSPVAIAVDATGNVYVTGT